ncbi:MAG: glycosyltransferase [Candidatus Omnitrophota bacterium]|nr:glycosyltransferase [Candidatus Omnitrophota bacterium]
MISIVTPTYNEAENVEAFTEGIAGIVKDIPEPVELIFVDAESPDGTAGVIRRLQATYPFVRLLERPKQSFGHALLAGCDQAKGDYLTVMDADRCQDPHDLVRLYAKLQEGSADMVIGSRYAKGGRTIGKSWWRVLGSRILNRVSIIALKLPLSDATHPFRLFHRRVYEQVRHHIHVTGHPSLIVELTYRVYQAGFTFGEIPVVYRERNAGRSKLNLLPETWNFLRCLVALKNERRASQ